MPPKNSPTKVLFGIEYLSLEEVVRRTGLSRLTVLKAFQSGLLPGKKLGGLWWTTNLWLAEWVETPDRGPTLDDDPNTPLRRAYRKVKRDVAQARILNGISSADGDDATERGDP